MFQGKKGCTDTDFHKLFLPTINEDIDEVILQGREFYLKALGCLPEKDITSIKDELMKQKIDLIRLRDAVHASTAKAVQLLEDYPILVILQVSSPYLTLIKWKEWNFIIQKVMRISSNQHYEFTFASYFIGLFCS
jgi:hypothetical protein